MLKIFTLIVGLFQLNYVFADLIILPSNFYKFPQKRRIHLGKGSIVTVQLPSFKVKEIKNLSPEIAQVALKKKFWEIKGIKEGYTEITLSDGVNKLSYAVAVTDYDAVRNQRRKRRISREFEKIPEIEITLVNNKWILSGEINIPENFKKKNQLVKECSGLIAVEDKTVYVPVKSAMPKVQEVKK